MDSINSFICKKNEPMIPCAQKPHQRVHLFGYSNFSEITRGFCYVSESF